MSDRQSLIEADIDGDYRMNVSKPKLGGSAKMTDLKLLEDVVLLDFSYHVETMFSKMDGLDKATFNILIRMAIANGRLMVERTP